MIYKAYTLHIYITATAMTLIYYNINIIEAIFADCFVLVLSTVNIEFKQKTYYAIYMYAQIETGT